MGDGIGRSRRKAMAWTPLVSIGSEHGLASRRPAGAQQKSEPAAAQLAPGSSGGGLCRMSHHGRIQRPDVEIADQSKSNDVKVGGKTQDIGAATQSASSLLTGCNWLLARTVSTQSHRERPLPPGAVDPPAPDGMFVRVKRFQDDQRACLDAFARTAGRERMVPAVSLPATLFDGTRVTMLRKFHAEIARLRWLPSCLGDFSQCRATLDRNGQGKMPITSMRAVLLRLMSRG